MEIRTFFQCSGQSNAHVDSKFNPVNKFHTQFLGPILFNNQCREEQKITPRRPGTRGGKVWSPKEEGSDADLSSEAECISIHL